MKGHYRLRTGSVSLTASHVYEDEEVPELSAKNNILAEGDEDVIGERKPFVLNDFLNGDFRSGDGGSRTRVQ